MSLHDPFKAAYPFSKGKRYIIHNSRTACKSRYDYFNPINGYGCVFLSLRKEGKHHFFREERGGWTRTYTDAQLLGKHIQEV